MDGLEGKLLLREFDAFAVPILAAAQRLSSDDCNSIVIYFNEARHSLELISPYIEPGDRILEIGSGIGALGAFLTHKGFDIVGLEPGGEGFARIKVLADFVREEAHANFQSLDIDISTAAPAALGDFDRIISFRVLEHVWDLEGAFGAMVALLRDGGEMIHICPNYFVPYEPHFGAPVFGAAPWLTKKLFSSRVSRAPELWDSLNFISAGRVKKLCLNNGLSCVLERGVMASFIRRAATDAEFGERHRGIVLTLSRLFLRTSLDRLIGAIPPSLSTPMVFRARRCKM